jgi:hypothetical protein
MKKIIKMLILACEMGYFVGATMSQVKSQFEFCGDFRFCLYFVFPFGVRHGHTYGNV